MRTKTVGRRRPTRDFVENAKLQELAVQLRGDRPFVPKGVYRFKTHAEAQEWFLQMTTRPKKKSPDPRR